MDRFYKQMGKIILAFSLGVTVFCLMGAGGAQASSDPFSVRGVKIDVTAENAVAAREQAFEEAQKKAFQMLTARLLSEKEATQIAPPEGELLASMVNDFEITSEQLSDVRYIGTYIFRFKQDDVRRYLGGHGMAYSDVSSKPVLILPFYRWGDRMLLWEAENPWRAAWSRNTGAQGLVPTLVPIGDLEDVNAIAGEDLMNYSAREIDSMVRRYGAGRVLAVMAIPQYKSGATGTDIAELAHLDVKIYEMLGGRATPVRNFQIAPAEKETVDTLFEKAIWRVHKTLQQSWKEKTSVRADQANQLRVRVRFASMGEWVETQKNLRGVQGVRDVKLLSLKPGEAQVELHFQGAEDRLRLALAQADMTLTTPQVSFTGAAAVPLVYDLYLNKYRQQTPPQVQP